MFHESWSGDVLVWIGWGIYRWSCWPPCRFLWGPDLFGSYGFCKAPGQHISFKLMGMIDGAEFLVFGLRVLSVVFGWRTFWFCQFDFGHFDFGQDVTQDVKILNNLRVWSWLRTNAGGRPNTCKSNEKLIFGLMDSGGRVSNAWVLTSRYGTTLGNWG